MTYTANVYFYQRQRWDELLAHIWSLSVEEPFYLIWPWLMIDVPQRFILPVIIIFISVGALRWYVLPQNECTGVRMITTFHAFGLGALLAWVQVNRPDQLPVFFNWSSALAALCLLLIALPMVPFTPFRTLLAPIALWVMGYLTINADRPSRLDFFIPNPVLLFLGRISYGLYLYHLFPFRLAHAQSFRSGVDLLAQGAPKWVVQGMVLGIESILLLLISWLSYRFIEQPCSGKSLDYRQRLNVSGVDSL